MPRSNRLGLLVVCAATSLAGIYAAAQDTAQPQVSPEAEEALDQLRTVATDVQSLLTNDKVLNCCIKPACVFCELAVSRCGCAHRLDQGQGVCPECFGGWYAGQGALANENVSTEPDKAGGAPKLLYKDKPLRLMPLSLLRAYYTQRAKGLGVDPAERPGAPSPDKQPSNDQ